MVEITSCAPRQTFSRAGIKPQRAPADHRHQRGDEDVDPRGQREEAGREHCADGPHIHLALGSDVKEAGPDAHGEGDRGEHQGGREGKGLQDIIRRAEGALEEGLIRLQRIIPEGKHEKPPGDQPDADGQQGFQEWSRAPHTALP